MNIVPATSYLDINDTVITAPCNALELLDCGDLLIDGDGDESLYAIVCRITLTASGRLRREYWHTRFGAWEQHIIDPADHAMPFQFAGGFGVVGELPVVTPGIYEIIVATMAGVEPDDGDVTLIIGHFYRDSAGKIHTTRNSEGQADYSIPIADGIVDRVIADSPTKAEAIDKLMGLVDAVEGAA